jgi:diguanylate cyclase (GGDEF)-like protein
MNDQQHIDLWKQFSRPIEITSWVIIVAGAILSQWYPLAPDKRQVFYGLLLASVVYQLVFYHWLVPRYSHITPVRHFPIVFLVGIFATFSYIAESRSEAEVLYVMLVAITGMRVGWRMAVMAAMLCTAASLLVAILLHASTAPDILSRLFQFGVYVLAGVLAGTLSDALQHQAARLARSNRELALLLETTRAATASLDLHVTLPRLAEEIAKRLPATFCRICLFDRHNQQLIIYGIYPMRALDTRQPGLGQSFDLKNFSIHRQVLVSGRISVLREDELANVINAPERALLFFKDMQSACLAPMIFEGKTLGLITVCDVQHWVDNPLDERKLDLLQNITSQVAVIVNNARLHQAAQRQIEGMAVLNEVAGAISSTHQPSELLELIYQQLNRVITTDSYIVALYTPGEDTIDMRILIDDGQRHPPRKIPVGMGLISLVLKDRRAVVVRHMTAEVNSLPIKRLTSGTNKPSESWVGVPMMIGNELLGVLAVASYKPYAFDDEDVALLNSIAGQAAIALDNARHHAEVEEQTRRDSLTGVYNHGYLLQRVTESVERGKKENTAVSLIMLDIDLFKKYNDTYGHVVGDEVLRLIVQAIQAHIKRTDVVGRWGGEEFAIVLAETTTEQARAVATRVRETLAALPLMDRADKPIPKPTVSQGIATFPDHADNAELLVDVADRALSVAKEAGRDQVRVATNR